MIARFARPGRGGRRMAAVGVAVAEHLVRALAEERLLDPVGDDDGAHRHVPRGQALGAGHDVRHDAEALAAEIGAEAAEAADDLVRDQQHVVLAAQLLHPRPEAVGRRDDAAGADHGLADEGRDVVGVILEQRLERVGVAPRDVLDVRHEIAIAHAVAGDPLQARAERVGAVVAVLARDDDLLLGAADRVPVAARELGRRVDGVGAAARGEEDRGAVHLRESPATLSASFSSGGLANGPNVWKAASSLSCAPTASAISSRP